MELGNNSTDPKLIWKAVLGKLQLQVNKSSFETWLSSTIGHKLEAESFTVSVPNNFVAEMLDQRMYSIIASAIEQVLKTPAEVKFIVFANNNVENPIPSHTSFGATTISKVDKTPSFYNKTWRTNLCSAGIL